MVGAPTGALQLNVDWKHNRRAIFYCLVATIGALCYGYDTIYYTGIQGMKYFAIHYGTKQPDGTYTLATNFLAVSASIIYVGEFTGAILSGFINDALGRRGVFLTASLCIIIGAIIQVCSSGLYAVFCVGRIFIGLGIGQFTATCLMYVAEVAPSEIRGPALMMFQFSQSVSQFVGACINQGTESIQGKASYQIPMALLMVLPLSMLILLPFTPESPVWYIFKGKTDKARKALIQINKSNPNYTPEKDLQTIEDQATMEREEAEQSSWRSLFADPIERRKLLYACGAMFAQQINGIQFWYTYGVVFAQSIGVAQPFTINTGIYVLQIVTVGLSVIFGNKMRRRVNLMVCSVGMLVSLVAVGGLGTTHRGGPFSRGVGAAIVVFAYLNVFFFNFSIGTLSYTIASEMSVGRNRNKITACAIGVFFFCTWLMVFTSPYMYYTARLGPMVGFVYGGTTLFGTMAYVWFCVGETTGRTNTEIDRLFHEKVPVRQWRTYRLEPEMEYQRRSISARGGSMAEEKDIVANQIENKV